MIYFFWGKDKDAKERRIAQIKTKYLTSNDALKLDYELLYGSKCDPDILKKSLIALPAISKKRLVLIRTTEKLSTQNKKIILEFIQTEIQHLVLIFDVEGELPRNNFFNKLMTIAQVQRFGQEGKNKNVFDMTRAMESRNSVRALEILDKLMKGGDHPLQIMGGLVWFWGKSKNRLPKDQFKKGLLVLQEADLNIKRSRLKPEYAVEMAVTKLSSLIAC